MKLYVALACATTRVKIARSSSAFLLQLASHKNSQGLGLRFNGLSRSLSFSFHSLLFFAKTSVLPNAFLAASAVELSPGPGSQNKPS